MQPVKVILNPYSGRGNGARTREEVRGALDRAGVPFDLEETTETGHGVDLAEAAHAAGYDTIVAAGGDGTVSEVMNGLARSTEADKVVGKLGLLPIGSGNDLSDILGHPRDLDEAARRLASGQTRHIDLGFARFADGDGERTRYFDNNLGMGFEAQVTLESYKVKRLSGSALYIMAVLRTLRSFHAPQVEMTWLDESGAIHRTSQRVLLVSVGNSSRTGGGFYLTPDALLDDGLLDVGIADHISRWGIVNLLPKALKGSHVHDPAVTMLRVRSLTVSSDETMPLHLDGEVVSKDVDRVEIEIQPGRLEIVC